MLLTVTSSEPPATDLGYLLHKRPDRVQSFAINFGKAHVFYPEVSDQRCTAALLLEIDPIGLVRGAGRELEPYVNDRPYVSSSFMSVAIGQVFGSALSGRSRERHELAARAIPLETQLSVVRCRGGEALLHRLFEPLGYEVTATPRALDDTHPEWGASDYFSVGLRVTARLAELLTHLYVLLPVLDDNKHYWVGDDEVDKLVRRGEGWLAAHPERELIARRYLKHKRSLAREALQLLMAEELPDPDERASARAQGELELERPIRLNEQRIQAVVEALKQTGASRVLDLGCGEGALLRALLADRAFSEIAGMDVSHRALEIAGERLQLERMPPAQRARLKLLQGSLCYRDERLHGYDAAALVEVIEHMDATRLSTLERVLFEFARPLHVIVTTPNAEYNVRFAALPSGRFRHADHRFEWSRAEFEAWCATVATRFGYTVRYQPIGPLDPELGSPTQMAAFSR